MNHLIFVDNDHRESLLPLTFTRPMAEIRIGIQTITEKWKLALNTDSVSYKTEEYLQKKYPLKLSSYNLLIFGAVCVNDNFIKHIKNNLIINEGIKINNEIVAVYADLEQANKIIHQQDFTGIEFKTIDSNITIVKNVWDIFAQNGVEINYDYKVLTAGRRSQELSTSNQTIHPEQIFLEEGAQVECCILNASTGPIYIGKDAEIMEGSVIRGPFALGEHAQVKLATKIYGPTTVGPHCRVGGEVNNSVLFAYSNKGHDGFLGNSVLGEWCNLGADTNNSNLKNNYGNVKLYNYKTRKQEDTGLQFCGLIMGDHSKTGINTMLNTGTVVGVSCNIYGADFPPTFIPSFSWGGAERFEKFKTDKAIELAERVFSRRNYKMTDIERDILLHIANLA